MRTSPRRHPRRMCLCGSAALVGADRWRVGADGAVAAAIARLVRQAVDGEGHRLCRAAVGSQRTKLRTERRSRGADLVIVDAVGQSRRTCAIADQVVAERIYRAGNVGIDCTVGGGIARDNGTQQSKGSNIIYPATACTTAGS